MRTAVNPITGNVLNETYNRVLTFGLSDAEMQRFSNSVVKGTLILSCDNSFGDILTTSCNCIVFAPSKMNAMQKAQMNEIYEDEKRILMLSVESHKTKFRFPTHTINLAKNTTRPHRKLNSFCESVTIPCVTNIDGYMLNDGFVVIDIETTGLDKEADELIFVSAVRIANYKIVDTFEMLIKPSKPIPKEIEELCEITNEMVSAAESAEMVVKKLIDFIRFDVIVTYDRGFIGDFLSPILQKFGYEINTNPRLNLFYLVRKLYSNQLFSLSSGVTSCASAIGVDITEIPSRFHEAEVLINILLRLRNEYELRSIAELEKLY